MNNIHSALDYIARRDIPDRTDLWPQIAARIERKDTRMNPKIKLAWTVVLVLLGLILATTAAYAVYRYFYDPGLQSVHDAGMFTDVDSTAAPTVLPTLTSDAGPGAVLSPGLEQTQNGVTVRLDWVSLLDPRQMFQISAQGLSDGMAFGMPQVGYPGVIPEQYEGAIFSLGSGSALTGRYVSYQIIRKDGQFGGQVDMQIDIPLMQRAGEQLVQVANFHFDLQDVPVIVPNGWGGGETYAVRVNGLEMRQVSSIVTPAYTQARVCYETPAGNPWNIVGATIQFSGQGQTSGPANAAQSITQAEDEGGQRCADLRFAQGKSAGDISFSITVNGLSNGHDKVDGHWQFYTGLIDDIAIPGMPLATPTATQEPPLDAQTNGDMTVTLLSAYADANRLALTLRVEGADLTVRPLNTNLTDENGDQINSASGFGPIEDQPNGYLLTFVPEDMSLSNVPGFSKTAPLSGERFKGKFTASIGTADGNGPETAFHFDLDIPVYQALTLTPGQIVTANGIEMRLEKLKVTPSYTRIYLCYSKPDAHDWTVGSSSTLQIGSSQVSPDSYGILSDPDFDLGKNRDPDFTPSMKTGRCVKLGYPVGYHDKPETLSLTVPELEQSIPEVIPDADVKKAQAALAAQGIEMDYVTFSGNGGGGGGPAIKQKPDGMSDQDVMRLFYEALGYYYIGPWTFTVEVNP